MNILKDLAKLDKQQVFYKNEEYTISAYEIERGIVKIYTDKKTLFINDNEFSIKDFKIMEQITTQSVAVQQDQNPYLIPPQPIKTVISGAEIDIKAIITHNIENIQKDKGYIDQASAINDQIKTLIDLAKTQILASKAK